MDGLGGIRREEEKVDVLIVGSGGREHALLRNFLRSKIAGKIYLAPGNGGTFSHNVKISSTNFEQLAEFARDRDCLTIVGPERPLVSGIVDYFRERGLLIFGPNRHQAELEGSKLDAKKFMVANGIPTAKFEAFESSQPAIRYAASKGGNVVVKVNGLADGKGVFVCSSTEESRRAIVSILDEKRFGEEGKIVLVEDKLKGEELSMFAICDGESGTYIGSATDHKRLFDGDRKANNPNTGGMGAYSPSEQEEEGLIRFIMGDVVAKVVKKTNYLGFLYVGLMLTENGPMVLEFNTRLGDPEAQVLLPRIKGDLLDTIYSIAKGDAPLSMRYSMDEATMTDSWHTLGVVMCSEGYPFNHGDKLGREIVGASHASMQDSVCVFHSGTRFEGSKLVTDGGRVLCVTGAGFSLDEARARAYNAIKFIRWSGEYHRNGIGKKELSKS